MRRFLSTIAVTFALCAPVHAWELKVCANPDGTPYSTRDGSGFENQIVQILADELGAKAQFVWMPNHRMRTARGLLHAGDCDAVMGVLDGQKGFLTSHAYYRSAYVFVLPKDGADITSLNDPKLADLRIGVSGGARRTTPPAVSIVRRGLRSTLVFYGTSLTPLKTETNILNDLEAGRIDMGILWGPMAGHLARPGLELRPVSPEIDIPFLPMFAALSIGLRPHDEALRDALDTALAARWDEVQTILADAQVPLLHLPRPVIGEVTQ